MPSQGPVPSVAEVGSSATFSPHQHFGRTGIYDSGRRESLSLPYSTDVRPSQEFSALVPDWDEQILDE